MTAKDLFYYALAFLAAAYGVYLLFYMTRDQAARAFARAYMQRARAHLDVCERHMVDLELVMKASLETQREMLDALRQRAPALPQPDESRRDAGLG
jgi:hypothetical protein